MSQGSNASSCLIEYGATFQSEPFASQFSLPFSHVSVQCDDESDDDAFRKSEDDGTNMHLNMQLDNGKIANTNETNADDADDDGIDVILKGRNPMRQSTKYEDSAFLSLQELLDQDESDRSTMKNDDIQVTEKETETNLDNALVNTIPIKTPISAIANEDNEKQNMHSNVISCKGDVYDQSPMITPAFARNSFYTQTPSTFTSTVLSTQKPKNTIESIIRKQQKQRSKKEKISKNTSSSVQSSLAPITPSAINYDDAFSKRLWNVAKPSSRTSNVKTMSVANELSKSMVTPFTNQSEKVLATSSQMRSNHRLSGRGFGEGKESKVLTQAQKLARATQSSSLFDTRKQGSSSTQYTWNNDKSDEHAFGPTFLSKKKRKSLNLDIIDIDDKMNTKSPTRSNVYHTTRFNQTVASPINRSPASQSNYGATHTSPYQTPPRSSKKSQGPLLRLLHSMRRSIDADSARLQSGMFAYRSEDDTRIDVNDPRNRAETIMDLTIVGDNPKPFINDESKVVVLGYVHDFFKNKGMIRTVQMPMRWGKIRNIAAPNNTAIRDDCDLKDVKDDLELFNDPAFVWICFTRENYFELSIGNGKQLRLYNPIVLESFGSNSFSIVIGTRLCEARPMGLPQLPKVPSHI